MRKKRKIVFPQLNIYIMQVHVFLFDDCSLSIQSGPPISAYLRIKFFSSLLLSFLLSFFSSFFLYTFLFFNPIFVLTFAKLSLSHIFCPFLCLSLSTFSHFLLVSARHSIFISFYLFIYLLLICLCI